VEIRDVPGYEPQTPIRWGNSAPGRAEQPGGDRAPRKSHARRPHGDAPRQAHAGPKKPGGQRSSGPRQANAGAGAGRRDGGRGGQRPSGTR
jgi:ATP-dependent RNA helicase RhlE